MPYKTQYRVSIKKHASLIIVPSAFHEWAKTQGELVSLNTTARKLQLQAYIRANLLLDAVVIDWELEDIFI